MFFKTVLLVYNTFAEMLSCKLSKLFVEHLS